MKKSLVAVSVIVALGAAWTGASWYTGKKVEARLDKTVQKMNTELTDAFPDSRLEMQVKDFQRGIFSSDVRFILSVKDDAKNAGMKPNEKIIFKSHIDHGPFPISVLKKFNFVPKMASIHSEIEQSDQLKELFEITNGKSLFNIDASVSYSGNSSSNIEIVPVEHTNKDGTKITFSGAKINTDISRDLSELSFSIKSDELTVDVPSEKRIITLKGIDFNAGDNKKGKFDLYLGNQNYAIGEITSKSSNGKDDFLLTNLKISTKMSENKENVNTGVAYEIDGLKMGNLDFGSGKLVFNADNLDGQAVHKFSQTYNDIIAKSFSTKGLEQSSQNMAADLFSHLPILLKNNPHFSIVPFSWKNSKGESTLDFKIALQNIPEDLNKIAQMGTEEQLRTLLQELSLNVKLSKPMLIEQITKSGEYLGEDKNKAEKTANMQVQFIAAQGAALNVVTNTDDAIDLNLHYANGKVKLNGKESSLHQFLLDNHLIDSHDNAGESNQHDSEAEFSATE
ncbi:YdgA family protein [Xenorhabdus budapestensis]|uniref:YdgA family protein n=1 Tax=Xenorhabdus budapestensis TaxID=290110 RepID=UPI003A866932